MERVLTGIVGRIVDDLAIFIVWLCQRTAFNQEGQIGLLAVTILKRSERLHTSFQPFHRLYVEVHTDGVARVVIVEQIVLLRGVAYRDKIRHGIAAARDVQFIFLNGTRTREVAPPIIVASDDIAVVVGHPCIRHAFRELEVGILLGISRSFGLGVQPQTLIVEREHLVAVHGAHLVSRCLPAVAA